MKSKCLKIELKFEEKLINNWNLLFICSFPLILLAFSKNKYNVDTGFIEAKLKLI